MTEQDTTGRTAAQVWADIEADVAPSALWQRQGDILVRPWAHSTNSEGPRTITPAGIVVAGGQQGANEHRLTHDAGPLEPTWRAYSSPWMLGEVNVPPGSTVLLLHTGHHLPLRLDAGRWVLVQQRCHVPAAPPAPAEKYGPLARLLDRLPIFGGNWAAGMLDLTDPSC